jgi:superfamily II DNA/RNA helicase
MELFSRLGLAEPLAEALASFGFEAPTAVQAETIPALLSRRDTIIESETGTGKTFAYLAPAFQLISVLERKGSGEPGALIAVPTQELAVQIGKQAERLAKAASLPLHSVVLLGGTPIEKQAAKLKAKPDVVIGTLGRLADLIALGKLRTSSLKILVLDEADRLFARETEELAIKLLASAPSSCVRSLVSATIPERLRREMRPLLRDALEICPTGETVLSESIEHWCFYCDGRKRLDFVRRFEAAVRPKRCLLFLTMASRVEKAAAALVHLGLPVEALHSGMDKETRRVSLERFASGELRYLLTSDLGARGLDIADISHVISLDLPEEPTIYTHRAGRTGRAGKKGVSIVLADGMELGRASKIATKGGFVYRCKVLEEGQVFEPTSEEFFARATAAEEQRMEAKAHKARDGETRASRESKPKERRPAPSRRRDTDFEPRPPRDAEGKEGPRTARKPASAPWRPVEGGGEKASHPTRSILHKKKDEDAPVPRSEARPPMPRNAAYGEARSDRPRTDRPRTDKPYSDRARPDRPHTDRPRSDRPRGDSRKPRGDKPYSDSSRSDRPYTDRARPDRPHTDRPPSDRPRGDSRRTRGDSRKPPRPPKA